MLPGASGSPTRAAEVEARGFVPLQAGQHRCRQRCFERPGLCRRQSLPPAHAARGNIAPPIPSPDFVSVNREGFVPPLHVRANRRCGTSAASELQHKAVTDFQRLMALTSQELRSALIDGFQAHTMEPELSIERETHNASARYVTLPLRNKQTASYDVRRAGNAK